MMNRLSLFVLLSAISLALKADPVSGLLKRILPTGGDADKFAWTLTPDSTEHFTFACDGRKVSVSGTSYVAIASGINWYLQHYAGIDISWNAPTAQLPRVLPTCQAERHEACVPWRYYLNFCTYSYSMAFWDWPRWQQEIDWMALHGVNMPLVITGMECVWRRVLEDYGYRSLDDVNTFVCGSAYYGWFFMNNLTAWGGPQPESWYRRQQTLATNIFHSMGQWGMSPVVPGYVGMVPKDFLARAKTEHVGQWQATDIVDGGLWNRFTRPAFVNNTNRLKEFAARYYAAFNSLYGKLCPTHFYAIDPFHEGGVPAGVSDATASVEAMWEALQSHDPQAVWVAQHWQDNPTTILTHTIPRGRLIILDLHGDSSGDTECSGHHTTREGLPHEWIWGQVSNFGGNVGLFGRMDRLINCFYSARDSSLTNNLVGIGAIPEGIENNAMLYDLLYALPWTSTDYTHTSWLRDYVHIRYGLQAGSEAYAAMFSAWRRLAKGIYNCPTDYQQGTTESVFLMRPALKARSVSTWAFSSWYWDIDKLLQALAEMLSASEVLCNNDNYRYDLVDVARQALGDHGKLLLDDIAAADPAGRRPLADQFLELILDQDRLLGTRRELRLGRWLEAARSLGSDTRESDLYERNARMLLTTWGEADQCEAGQLHDYANREWNGLLASYYYPRWRAFFDNGCTPQKWFNDFEWPFATGDQGPISNYLPPRAHYAYGSFSAQPEGNEIATVRNLYTKYFKRSDKADEANK